MFFMSEDRQKQLENAVEQSEKAVALIREFEGWKKTAISLTKNEILYFALSKNDKEKSNDIKNILLKLSNIVTKPEQLQRKFEDEDQSEKREEQRNQETLLKQNQNEEFLLKTQYAILYLQNHGFELGRDFNLANCIKIADDEAYKTEIQQHIKNNCWEFFSFLGDDNCELHCHGWDGLSKHCECSSCRVRWKRGDSHSFMAPDVFAQAL